jgi:hypothetical protein
MNAGQFEITEPSPLLTPNGELAQVGWARRPLLDCNLEQASFYRLGAAQRYRIKRWDYYGVTFPDGYFSATIANLGYVGQVFTYLVDFAAATYREATITIPFGTGTELPRNSDAGVASYAGRKAQLSFDAEPTSRSVSVGWERFGDKRLEAYLHYDLPADHESTVIVIPIETRRFYLNRKINCMPVKGKITLGDEIIQIEPETSSGNLDWGRGVWAYNSFWVWASASGFLGDGRRVGLNLGYGFGDTSAATENTVLINGRINKLGEVVFEYDNADFMATWRMRSDRVDLSFTPFLDRTAQTNLMVIRSEVHQMFGHYSGVVADDRGNDVPIEGLIGWAEEHRARW